MSFQTILTPQDPPITPTEENTMYQYQLWKLLQHHRRQYNPNRSEHSFYADIDKAI